MFKVRIFHIRITRDMLSLVDSDCFDACLRGPRPGVSADGAGGTQPFCPFPSRFHHVFITFSSRFHAENDGSFFADCQLGCDHSPGGA